MNQDIDYDACERFYEELESYLEDYKQKVLNVTFKRDASSKHYRVIHSWCEYITLYKGLVDFSNLKVSLINSRFHSYYNSQGLNDDELKNITLSNIIHKFLFFIYDRYGIANKAVLEKIGRKQKSKRKW